MPVATGKHTADITAEVGGQHNVDKLHKISRDFRTDTITIPTDAQLLAALTATRGDDVYGEDAATRELEERIARLTGKEAAMFGSSGTMTNQIAIKVHMKSPPQSVLVDHRAHIHCMEAGGIAMFTQATTYSVVPSNGEHMTLEDIKPNLRLGEDIHYAPTKLICLENTLSGMVFPQDEVVRIGEMAKSHGIAMHLDGARIFEVAAKEVEARGLDPRKEEDIQTVLTELCAPFDSASLCLSKGIGAPVGSATVGTKEFIARAKWFRKAFGGGVRQIGPTAAAADHAITHHFPRLAGTHALARRLGEGLKELGVDIIAPIHTNMVFFDPTPIGVPIEAIFARLAALDDPITVKYNRLVIHHQTSPQAVEDLIACVREMKSEVEDGKGQQVKVEGQDVARDSAMQQEKKIRQQTLGY